MKIQLRKDNLAKDIASIDESIEIIRGLKAKYEEEVKKVKIVDNKNKRNYIDITDIVINDLNKEKNKCK